MALVTLCLLLTYVFHAHKKILFHCFAPICKILVNFNEILSFF